MRMKSYRSVKRFVISSEQKRAVYFTPLVPQPWLNYTLCAIILSFSCPNCMAHHLHWVPWWSDVIITWNKDNPEGETTPPKKTITQKVLLLYITVICMYFVRNSLLFFLMAHVDFHPVCVSQMFFCPVSVRTCVVKKSEQITQNSTSVILLYVFISCHLCFALANYCYGPTTTAPVSFVQP